MYRLRRFFYLLTALVIALCCVLLVKVGHLSRFADIKGERVYFLDSASSQGLQKTSLSLLDITRVKGECVYSTIFDYAGGRCLTTEEVVQEIMCKYDAKELFFEEVNGIYSCYAYTDEWADSIHINGKMVNLHVAVGKGRLTIGAPIIFGGY